jgi:hypothetical protein
MNSGPFELLSKNIIDNIPKKLYYVTIQFVITCDYLAFATMFYITTNNHFYFFKTIFATMVPLKNYTYFHID